MYKEGINLIGPVSSRPISATKSSNLTPPLLAFIHLFGARALPFLVVGKFAYMFIMAEPNYHSI